MKTLITFLALVAITSCTKQEIKQPTPQAEQTTFVITCVYNIATDTVYMWRNNKQVHPGGNLVNRGDVVRVQCIKQTNDTIQLRIDDKIIRKINCTCTFEITI